MGPWCLTGLVASVQHGVCVLQLPARPDAYSLVLAKSALQSNDSALSRMQADHKQSCMCHGYGHAQLLIHSSSAAADLQMSLLYLAMAETAV